ncbi:MAG: Fic family protein [Planctomycetes bacterium]|nr:Fic family protein [Planctomycetota bacterium]
MQIERFGEFKTGCLVPIALNERVNDYAFVPNPLPPSWRINDALWPLIATAREKLGNLNGIGCTLPTPALLLRPLQRREAITSNSIEGTHVTPEELLLFEADQKQHMESARRNDWLEVSLYDQALNEGCRRISEGHAIDRHLMIDLHHMLLSSARGKEKSPGQIRNVQVFIGEGRRFIPPPPELLEEQITNLESYLASNAERDPLLRAFIAHYQFEVIHPFKDGNGRIGRLILSLCIYKWLGHSHAWLYLSEYFDRNRREYIGKLSAVSTSGEWEEWVEFCLHGTIEQADSAIARCHRLGEIKRKYEAVIGDASARMSKIITRLLTDPIVEVTQLAEHCDVTYHTAKADIDKLLSAGVLTELKSVRRPKAYCATEIFNVAYGD